MDFEPPLQRGILLRRYKRFLADIVTASGAHLTIHCPNPGAMTGCADAGSRVWYSRSRNAHRKYPHTLEIVETPNGDLVGVNPSRANAIVGEAVCAGRVVGMTGGTVRREAPIPDERGRFDFRIDYANGAARFVEVKSVTMARERGIGAFPDARSERARRHIEALRRLRVAGHASLMLFCVQHSAVARMTIADDIDPDYGVAIRAAHSAGVEVAAYKTMITPARVVLGDAIPVML